MGAWMMKTNEEVAREVINGEWGNGNERIVALTNAGYNASAIQRIVNQMLKDNMVTDEPEVKENTKQILEVTVDLKKYGALILNFME